METNEKSMRDEMMGEMTALLEKLMNEKETAMEKMEHRFMTADCSREIDTMIEASFNKEYVESLMIRVSDMDVKRATLLIRYHSHYLATYKSPVSGKKLSEMLDKLADRLDELRNAA